MPRYAVRVFRQLEQETVITLETPDEKAARNIAEQLAIDQEAYLEWTWADSNLAHRDSEVREV